jgi:hypothetical protein
MTSEERDRLIAQYSGGYREVQTALDGLPPAAMTAHPFAGKWSAREIIHHLSDSESISAQRLRRLISEERPVIQGYDQDAWAVLLRYNLRDHAPALELFRAVRATTAQLLPELTDEDWQRAGWHTEHGLYTPTTWLQIYAVHAHNHAGQIARLKAALAK